MKWQRRKVHESWVCSARSWSSQKYGIEIDTFACGAALYFIGKKASGTHDATLQHIMMTDADSEGYVQDETSAATDNSITDDEESLVKQDEP